MPESPEASPAVKQLLSAIQTQDIIALQEAAKAVQEAGEVGAAVEQVGQVLSDVNQENKVRAQAAFTLNLLGDPSAKNFLEKSLAKDKDPAVRRICLTTLEQLDPEGLPTYYRQAIKDKEPAIKVTGLSGLEQVDPIGGIEDFQRMLTDPDSGVSVKAKDSLGIAIRDLIIELEASDEADRQNFLDILKKITIGNLETQLLREDEVAYEDGLMLVPEASAKALGIDGGSEAIEALCHFLDIEIRIQTRFEQLSEDELDRLDREQRHQIDLEGSKDKSRVMFSVVNALEQTNDTAVVPCLGETLRNNTKPKWRRASASALGRLGFDEAINHLCYALLEIRDPAVQQVVVPSLSRVTNWRHKVNEIIQVLSDGALQRAQIDVGAIVKAVQPPEEERKTNPNLLTDYLIEQAVPYLEDERLVNIFAALIIASEDGNVSQAGRRVRAFQEQGHASGVKLRPLRVQIGGKEALRTELEGIEEDLKTFFMMPLLELNSSTRKEWRRTIIVAQIGFGLRALMSVILFVIGAYLVLNSYQAFISGNLNTDDFFGPGVSFITGLGTMLAMIYTGPLKEIRRAVTDTGAASAAFIAYIHRILQVSHTFSYLYRNEGVNFKDLFEAWELIQESLDDTIAALYSREPAKNEDKQSPTEGEGKDDSPEEVSEEPSTPATNNP